MNHEYNFFGDIKHHYSSPEVETNILGGIGWKMSKQKRAKARRKRNRK